MLQHQFEQLQNAAAPKASWPLLHYPAVACVARRQAAVRVAVGGGLLALRPTANRGLMVAAAELEGERVVPYQYVRIWGTIGFIVPSLLLYFLIRNDGAARVIIWVATASCILAACNAFLLTFIQLVQGAN